MSALAHNWRVLQAALKADRAERRGRQPSTEAAFLPAALEVIETPVSPTGRVTAWVLLVGLLATVVWLVVGRVDVVASAPGKIIPSGSVKIVQSAGSGVVRAIHVHDGDQVTRGQVLVELDTTLSAADLQQARKALLAAEIDIARNRAIFDALSGRGGRFDAPSGTQPEVAVTQQRLVDAQVGAVNATTASLSAARSSAMSDAAAAAAQARRLSETGPILDRELEAMRRLDAKGYAPGMRLLELQRQRRGEVGDLEVASAQQVRGRSEALKLAHQINEARTEAKRVALADLARAEGEAILRREEVTKAERRTGLQVLRAPESGTVQQLTLHTLGGVVEPARTLMVVVPNGRAVEVEAKILNRDSGFVREGQDVVVKVDAFPFTRYGSVAGRVSSISRDAVPDPKLGSTFVARVTLPAPTLTIDGRRVILTPGLAVTADIRTGSRRVISYLLSPVQTSLKQAGHER